MQHELQPDSLVDLKFIMADTGFGKTFIYDRIKSGDLPKAKVIHGRARWLYRDHCEFKNKLLSRAGNDSNLLIVFYVQIMPDDFVMQLHRF
ncbi:excisionase [Escherichia coli]|nr:excisionase [Escherichia coli]